MRTITTLHRSAALPENIQTPITGEEQHIFDYINSVCEAVPTMSSGKYPIVTARVAGGWIRDKLMPLVRNDVPVKPPKDLDFAIDNMDGPTFGEFMLLYDKIHGISAYRPGTNKPATAQKVGVVIGSIYGYEIEITQLRKEEYGIEGDRKSVEVEAGSLQEDTYRRDLTINAMYYNLRTQRVEDVTGQGYDDLATLTLRTPSQPGLDPVDEVDRIFTEDPVRALRVIRFFSRWPNAHIDPAILQKLSEPKMHELISRKLRDPNLTTHDPGVAAEALADELRKIMMGEQPAEAMEVLSETGLLADIMNLPEDFSDLDMNQRNSFHDLLLIEHTLEVIRNVNKLSKEFGLDDQQRMMMNFSALFHDIGKLDPRSQKEKPAKEDGTVDIGYYGNPNHHEPMRHEQSSQKAWLQFASALKLTNLESRTVSDIVINHMEPHSHVDDRVQRSVLGEFKDKHPLWKETYIHAMADAMSKQQEPDEARSIPYRDTIESIEDIELPPKFRGDEIMRITGMKAGPEIGKIIGKIREQQYKNLDLPQPLSPEEAKQQAVNIIFDSRDDDDNLIIPEATNRDTVRQYLEENTGIAPGRPPEGMPGVLQFIKEKIIQERNRRAINGMPQMTEAEIQQIMQDTFASEEFNPYR